MLQDAIIDAYRQFEERSWNKIYFAVDIHGTIANSDYTDVSSALFDVAREPLREISMLPEVSIILFSCCYPRDYGKYIKLLADNDVIVSYFNENPEVANTATGCFDSKFYYNLIAEDKAGFRPWHWPSVRDTFMLARQFNKRVAELHSNKGSLP